VVDLLKEIQVVWMEPAELRVRFVAVGGALGKASSRERLKWSRDSPDSNGGILEGTTAILDVAVLSVWVYVPIAEHYRPEIEIELVAIGAVDNDGTNETIQVLRGVVSLLSVSTAD